VSVGKWLFGVNPATAYKLFIIIEPTEGVDVGAKEEIHSILDGLASEGVSVLLVSSDLAEVANVAHRIYVFAGGRIKRLLHQDEFNEQSMLSAMASIS
jgi:ribose transport system ATP-binding protein